MSSASIHSRTSGVAIAALVLSILSIVLGPFGCIPGIVCGHIARSQCSRDASLDGDGLALAGLIVGYVFLVVMVLTAALVLLIQIQPAAPAQQPFVYPLS